MKIKVLYRRNLKMSEGKLAAQVAHSVLGLYKERGKWQDLKVVKHYSDWDGTIIVLKVSDKKFEEKINELNDYPIQIHYLQRDWGLTEVEEGTPTTLAFYEE